MAEGSGSLVSLGLHCDITGIEDAFPDVSRGLGAIAEMRAVVLEYADKLQAAAVRNVSGVQVTYSGGTFLINRVTGKLARSISVLPGFGGGALSAVVVASAEYASAVENGSRARDMKALLMGKTVPFPVTGTAKEKKALVAAGKATAVQKFASTGRKTRVAYIAFRKIGPKSKGWIIPAQPARPFMAAAAEEISADFQKAIRAVFQDQLDG